MALFTEELQVQSIQEMFLVPDYYGDFSCKGGTCRNSCCIGWKVTIPMSQYFKLHGLQTDKKMREKIDRTFRPLLTPSPERYAEISHKSDGDCPMHLKNGYCELHSRFGEDILPAVCRIYPRGPKTDYAFESSCTNSCEKTLELLFATDKPIGFETRLLRFRVQKSENRFAPTDRHRYERIRSLVFERLVDRSKSLSFRLLEIGPLLAKLDQNPDAEIKSVEIHPNPNPDVSSVLGLFESITEWFRTNHPKISDLCEEALLYHRENPLEAHLEAKRQFESEFPNHEVLFEKLLMNNMFFRQFPFQDARASYSDEFLSIVGTYGFIRYISLPLMTKRNGIEAFVDIMAKLFRVISHTRFDRNITALLKEGTLQADRLIQDILAM